MHETPEDLAALQDLLDRSYAQAGPHLLRIITPERRLSAEQVAERLTGCGCWRSRPSRPTGGRSSGRSTASSSAARSTSARRRTPCASRHIGARPQVSATHLPGEELAVTVHGRAVPVDVAPRRAPASGRRCWRSTSLATGRSGREFLDSGPVYARIDPERMFTFHLPADADADASTG